MRRKKIDLDRIVEYKYSLLLALLLALIITSPLTLPYPFINFFVVSFLFIFIMIAMLVILKAGRTLLSISLVVAFLAILFDFLETLGVGIAWVSLSAAAGYFFYVGLAIVFLLRNIFSERLVTSDTIKGGISIYILLGILWALAYHFLWILEPSCFAASGKLTGPPNFFYFSFTTMTTLGYGDIVPTTNSAKIAAMLEAIAGQVYIGVFVARLVGLHIAHSHHQR